MTSRCTIVLTVNSLIPESGVSEYVVQTADQLASLGHKVAVLCWEPLAATDLRPTDPSVSLVGGRKGCWLSKALAFAGYQTNLIRQAKNGNRRLIFHDNGVWLPSNLMSATIALLKGIPIVVSPHGMLTVWAFRFRPLKKIVFWHFFQKRLLDKVSFVHCTSESEAQELGQLLSEPRITITGLGVSRPDFPEKESRERIVLFLSRIHPKKGLDELIRVWARINPLGWRLVVAGTDSGNYQAKMFGLAATLGILDRIDFVGPVFGPSKWALYDKAMLFVLPTHSENFGMVIAEALASGVPVITTKEAPWRVLEECACGWWIDKGEAELEMAMRHALNLPDAQLAAMGENGRSLMRNRYSWQKVTVDLNEEYQRIAS